ncbi:MAG TPA: WD40 repeat domain-containing protein, partial [Isosphaeraceae bacterium]|nr:WD40 repeat domain-containing protein [Isosphaeraceae bacterium]
LEGHEDWVRSVAFHDDGYMLASGSSDRTVKLWEWPSGKLLRTLEGHRDNVRSVAFDSEGYMLASGSRDETIKLWETTSGRLLRTLEGHTGPVDAVACSADGRLLASKSHDGTIRVWSCRTWETIAVIPEQTNRNWWVPALAFHPNLPPSIAATGHSGLGARCAAG